MPALTPVVNTYHFEVAAWNCGEDNKQDMLAVLTQDVAGQFAVYLGAWKAPAMGDDPSRGAYAVARRNASEWIAARGHKLNHREAKAYFPSLKESEYRR